MHSIVEVVLKKTKAGGIALAAVAALTLAGCGGGDSLVAAGTGAANVTGKFVDAPVAGLGYKCGTSTALSGSTNSIGEFTCKAGETVAFYVGNIKLGSALAQTVVTPMDLVGTGAGPSHPRVINIVRFLMSISSTPASGGTLTIDPAVMTAAASLAIDFTQDTPTNLDTVITALKPVGATVASSADATAHMASSINGLFAGSFSGTFAGSLGGTWALTINSQGAVNGTATDSTQATYSVTGNMATTVGTGSTYAFTGTSGGVPWTGTLNLLTKQFSGTWNDGAGASGTFTGSAATAPAPAAAGAPTASGLTPATGTAGSAVTITGTNLTAVTQVLFTGPSPSFSFVAGTTTAKSATSITATVPATLAAGSYTVTVVHAGGEVTVGTLSVSGTAGGGGGGATGLTFSPAFNGLSTFANSVPYNNGGTGFVYSVGVGIPNVTVNYLAAANTGSENITISVMPDLSGATASLDQGSGFAASMCILTATAGVSAPVCSAVGVSFNRATGSVSFVNTPMKSIFGSTATTFTLNGALTFTPF